MASYILRRLLLLIPTLLGILSITFLIMQFVPGGPVEQVLAQLQRASPRGEAGGSADSYHGAEGIDPAQIAAIRHEFGFDVPPWKRYFRMLGHYAQFDLGQSFFQHKSVWKLICEKLPVTATIGGLTLAITYLISLPLGIAKALRKGSPFDLATTAALLVGYAIPGFVLGVLLLVVFGHLFPAGGLASDGIEDASPIEQLLDLVWHLVLPVSASVVSNFAVVTLLTKNTFLDELSKQYVLTARAKGVPRKDIVWKHVLRNALIPLVTGLPSAFVGALVGGSLLIETLFSLD
jgi:microcin C transport system permease protein